MEQKLMEKKQILKNESGSVLVIALIMLVLLTVLGITATSTSNIELQIANNERNYKKAFYVANAAIESARASLAVALAQAHPNEIASGGNLDWGFALVGATDETPKKLWVPDTPLTDTYSDYHYTVTIWNDEVSPTVDSNGRIYAQAVAEGPNNVKVTVQVILAAVASGSSTDSYSQYGGDMTKNFNGNDLNAPTSDDTQIGTRAYISSI
jgi:Tfp pilus assembly protein PilX